MATTSDRDDERLKQIRPDGQQEAHIVLPDEARTNFIRPVRRSYRHLACGSVTTMGQAIAETYATNPSYYGATFCAHCKDYFPVGEDGVFVWVDDETKVGT